MLEVAPRPVPTTGEFEALYRVAGRIGVAECWTHCGSYCCKTNHPDQKFALMKCDSAGLVYSHAEYDFLRREGRLQAGAAETTRHHEFQFDPARNLRLRFVTTTCDLGGRCSDAEFRPLICKFYPYYPAPETVGDVALSTFVTGSIIDQHWKDLGQPHPCWIVRERSDEVTPQVQAAVDVMQTHPYFIFYVGAAAIFVRHVADQCRAHNLPVPGADLRAFFRDWEVRYLTGNLVDVARLRPELTAFYDAVVNQYGSFEL